MTETTPAPEAAPHGEAEAANDTTEHDSTDWKSEARKWEERAKRNSAAAQRLAEIEDSQKSEADRIAALETEVAKSRADAMRLRIAAKHGISDDDADLFLTGSDEDTLTRQAKRLAERETARKKTGNVAPREGQQHTPSVDDERTFVRDLFGAGD